MQNYKNNLKEKKISDKYAIRKKIFISLQKK